MSILSGHKKYERYLKTNNGYQLCSMKTYADSVHFSDGTTVQNNLGAIKGITDSLTATSSNVALSAAAGNNLQTQVSELNSNLSAQVNRLYIPNLNTATFYRHGIVTPETKNLPVTNIYGDLYYSGDIGYIPGSIGWATQMLISSDEHIYWRHAINEAGWSTWKRIDSSI